MDPPTESAVESTGRSLRGRSMKCSEIAIRLIQAVARTGGAVGPGPSANEVS